MKIVHGTEAQKFEDGTIFTAYEYNTQDPDINTARIEINGRYPLRGSMRNMKVKEIIYVESGSGEVSINGVIEKIEKGDVILFEAGEQIFWNGKLTLIISCTPAWTKEQHESLP